MNVLTGETLSGSQLVDFQRQALECTERDSLRKLIKEQAAKIFTDVRLSCTRTPSEKLLEHIDQNSIKSIALFAPAEKWAEYLPVSDLESIFSDLEISYPRIEDHNLVFRRTSSSQLDKNFKWGVLEASSNAPTTTPEWIFVPAMAVDRGGNRLGRGGGFYDRYLRDNPQVKTCACVSRFFLFDQLKTEFFHSGDQKVDFVLCEEDFFPCAIESKRFFDGEHSKGDQR